MILFKIILVCRLFLPGAPGDGEIYTTCQATITPGAPVEESSGQVIIDYMLPAEEPEKEREI